MMESDHPEDITGLLHAWSLGDQGALDRLAPMIEHELRRLARFCLGAGPRDPVLDTSALINEAYLRLIDASQTEWRDRAHFFAVSARIMRHILVDQARARHTAKRGKGAPVLPLEECSAALPEPASDIVAIDEALEALTQLDARKGRVVELRFYGGLTVEETAEVLNISPHTVRRDWRLAKAWLLRQLGGAEAQ
jgi:RNA polymerase sigma factor (TIGR02999 family)